MPKTLACRLGRHSWEPRAEEGETYTVCAVCGKTGGRPGDKTVRNLDDLYDARDNWTQDKGKYTQHGQ
jgi:hypothetical protein